MPTTIVEFHGAPPLTEESVRYAKDRRCPFIEARCEKRKSERGSGGACSLRTVGGPPVITCRNRLYGGKFSVIRSIARECFGAESELISKLHAERRRREGTLTGHEIVVFGQGFGGELGISGPRSEEGEASIFKIDFLLTKVDAELQPTAIIAVEVQTIDTTNSYRPTSQRYYAWDGGADLSEAEHMTKAGFNWENVTKRILPQIIYKGHALRRDRLAQHGLFFVLPSPVFSRIKTRIGNDLLRYPKGPGTVTFKPYDLVAKADGAPGFELRAGEELTTTVEQIAFAFVSPRNLPEPNVYELTTGGDLAGVRTKRSTTLERDIAALEAQPIVLAEDEDAEDGAE